jgi:hypothetical protein
VTRLGIHRTGAWPEGTVVPTSRTIRPPVALSGVLTDTPPVDDGLANVPEPRLAVRCWCESTIVEVPASWIRAGTTGSCGARNCFRPAGAA